MKKIKENKGITLIALIITIIVLIILAVVAINAVRGDGIIAHAKNARDDFQTAQKQENETLQKYLNDIEENTKNNTSENSYFNNYGKTYISKEDGFIRSALTFTKEDNKLYVYRVDFRGENYTNLDGADKFEVMYLNVNDNIDKINEYLDWWGDDKQIAIENVAPYCFWVSYSTPDTTDPTEQNYYFFNKDYTKLIDDSYGEFEIGEFDYQSYFND